MYVEYTTDFWKEAGQIVGHAMPVDVMSCGDTEAEASQALDEAVRIFMERALEMGTLEKILTACGYERINDGWIIPQRPEVKARLVMMGA